MQAIDVFVESDRLDHLCRIEVLRQRGLHQNAVHFGISIQLPDACQQRDLGCIGRKPVDRRANADLLARHALVAHVDSRSRIVSHQNDSKARPVTGSAQPLDARHERVAYFGRKRLAIDDASSHGLSAFRLFGQPTSLRGLRRSATTY